MISVVQGMPSQPKVCALPYQAGLIPRLALNSPPGYSAQSAANTFDSIRSIPEMIWKLTGSRVSQARAYSAFPRPPRSLGSVSKRMASAATRMRGGKVSHKKGASSAPNWRRISSPRMSCIAPAARAIVPTMTTSTATLLSHLPTT